MRLKPHPKIYDDIKDLSPGVQKFIWDELEKLKSDPTGHEYSQPIEVKDRAMFRYKIKKERRGGKIDHRAIYDIEDGKIKVIAIFHRDEGYDKEKISDRF